MLASCFVDLGGADGDPELLRLERELGLLDEHVDDVRSCSCRVLRRPGRRKRLALRLQARLLLGERGRGIRLRDVLRRRRPRRRRTRAWRAAAAATGEEQLRSSDEGARGAEKLHRRCCLLCSTTGGHAAARARRSSHRPIESAPLQLLVPERHLPLRRSSTRRCRRARAARAARPSPSRPGPTETLPPRKTR